MTETGQHGSSSSSLSPLSS